MHANRQITPAMTVFSPKEIPCRTHKEFDELTAWIIAETPTHHETVARVKIITGSESCMLHETAKVTFCLQLLTCTGNHTYSHDIH